MWHLSVGFDTLIIRPSNHPFSPSDFIQDQKPAKEDRPDILFSRNTFQLLPEDPKLFQSQSR